MTKSRFCALAITACLASACRGGAPEITRHSPAGECSVSEPGSTGASGVAAYTEHVTPTAGGGFGIGSVGVTITCATGGPARDLVVLILPNLTGGQRPLPGNYRVRAPGDSTLRREEALDPRLAWARVTRGVDAPVLYMARAGTVALTRSEDGLLEGAYQIALSVADSAVSLPGAPPEVTGVVATDSTGRPPTGNTVLGGAFLAPGGRRTGVASNAPGPPSRLGSRHGLLIRWLAVTTLASPLVFVYGFQLTYNSTESLPVGIYQVRELRGPPARGDFVGFCLEGAFARLAVSRGYVHREGLEPFVYGTRCASGAAVIGKPVAGLPGDTVEMRRSGVWINGVRVANSGVVARDRAGRKMPHPCWGRRVLGKDEYWLQSAYSARSFDSRYYGPVQRPQILDLRHPVLVRGSRSGSDPPDGRGFGGLRTRGRDDTASSRPRFLLTPCAARCWWRAPDPTGWTDCGVLLNPGKNRWVGFSLGGVGPDWRRTRIASAGDFAGQRR